MKSSQAWTIGLGGLAAYWLLKDKGEVLPPGVGQTRYVSTGVQPYPAQTAVAGYGGRYGDYEVFKGFGGLEVLTALPEVKFMGDIDQLDFNGRPKWVNGVANWISADWRPTLQSLNSNVGAANAVIAQVQQLIGEGFNYNGLVNPTPSDWLTQIIEEGRGITSRLWQKGEQTAKEEVVTSIRNPLVNGQPDPTPEINRLGEFEALKRWVDKIAAYAPTLTLLRNIANEQKAKKEAAARAELDAINKRMTTTGKPGTGTNASAATKAIPLPLIIGGGLAVVVVGALLLKK